MRSKIKLSLILLLFFSATVHNLRAQDGGNRTRTPAQLYSEGVALFEEGNYGSAIHKFEELQSLDSGLLKEASAYYLAASRLGLGNPNGEAELKKFISDQPESPMMNAALFRLANLSFDQKKYKEALQLYQKLEVSSLSDAEHEKFLYYSGISLLETGEKAKAKENFNQLRNSAGTFGDGSKYYWGHLSYLEGHYDDA